MKLKEQLWMILKMIDIEKSIKIAHKFIKKHFVSCELLSSKTQNDTIEVKFDIGFLHTKFAFVTLDNDLKIIKFIS